MIEKYDVKYELYCNKKINKYIFKSKNISETFGLFKLPTNFKNLENHERPKLNEFVKINFKDAIAYTRIVSLFIFIDDEREMYYLNINYVDIIKK